MATPGPFGFCVGEKKTGKGAAPVCLAQCPFRRLPSGGRGASHCGWRHRRDQHCPAPGIAHATNNSAWLAARRPQAPSQSVERLTRRISSVWVSSLPCSRWARRCRTAEFRRFAIHEGHRGYRPVTSDLGQLGPTRVKSRFSPGPADVKSGRAFGPAAPPKICHRFRDPKPSGGHARECPPIRA
jgi:hypothetical protein